MSKQTSIATLTLNPAVDITYDVKQLVADCKCSSSASRYDPGGNGINVSRTLHKLGIIADTHYFVGQESGVMLQELLNPEVDNMHPVPITDRIRINCTVQQRRPPEEYKLAGVGPAISQQELDQIIEEFMHSAAGGLAVLTGSLPATAREDEYAIIAHKLMDGGARIAMDIQPPLMPAVLKHKPWLVKMNHYEMEQLCGKSLPTIQALTEEARNLQKMGISVVCISLGADGGLLVNPKNSYFSPTPKVKRDCSNGAGDAMLGGFLAGFVKGLSCEEALKLAVCCGSLTMAQPGTQLFAVDELDEAMASLEVKKLDI